MTAKPLRRTEQDTIAQSRADMASLVASLHQALDAAEAGDVPQLPGPSEHAALETLVALFGLSPAERNILLLAAGAELDPTLAERIGTLRGYSGAARADVTMALALLPEGGWEALCSGAPLRHWRMIDIVGSGPYLRREIVLDERILHFLMKINYLDTRLEGLVYGMGQGPGLSPREQKIADQLTRSWDRTDNQNWPILLLAGQDAQAKRSIMQQVARELGLRLYRIDASLIPDSWLERHAISVFCDRELLLSGAALLIEGSDPANTLAAAKLADTLQGPVALLAEDPELPKTRLHRVRVDLTRADRSEKKAIWCDSLREYAETLGPGIERLSEQFSLDHASMETVVDAALNGTPTAPDRLFRRVWSAAREQSRRRIGGLADRIESNASWENLVLPADQLRQLQELTAHVGQAWQVYQNWGWEQKSSRGLGAAALFAGPSGTGKTLAAEVLAGELQLDLYRIDLSQVVSKYIGETEKNLSRIFTAAEEGGAILLFDEADALFGKRSDVKDSHDRYANVEVSYLLQQMETYRGLTILTTNQKSALDPAFLRRLRFAISFPFPDAVARAAIWAQIFPTGTPLNDFDVARLARMNITGGSIRSIALNASFLAASDEAAVGASHILRAAQREYAKLEKPLTGSELGEFR